MSKRRITIKDIARETNLSIGTIDRAIHGRGRISDETRELILQKIEELGYKPNNIARALSQNKVTRIAVVTPSYNYFFQDIIKGVQTACRELADYSIELELMTQDSENDPLKQLRDFAEVMQRGVGAVIVAPLHPFLLSGAINRAAERNIPVITVNLDSKDSRRLCYVGQDPFKTGTIVGTLFGKFLQGQGDIAVLTGISELISLQQRTEGFLEGIKRDYPGINVIGTHNYTDGIEVAYEISKMLIENNKGLRGIFANTTAGTIGAGMAIRDSKKAGSIVAVSYDTQPEIRDLFDSGALAATVTQNPFSQGYCATKLLHKILLERYNPEKEFYYTRADVIVSSLQLDLYEAGVNQSNFI